MRSKLVVTYNKHCLFVIHVIIKAEEFFWAPITSLIVRIIILIYTFLLLIILLLERILELYAQGDLAWVVGGYRKGSANLPPSLTGRGGYFVVND